MGVILSLIRPSKKLTTMDTATVVKRLSECVIPDDKEIILDYFEMLDEKIESERDAQIFKDEKGVLSVMKIIKRMSTDTMIVRLGLTIFDNSRVHIFITMDFILYGGIELLKKMVEEHSKDIYLSVFIPQLLKDILLIGAKAAMNDIIFEESNLKMCHCCQEIIERYIKIL